MGLETKCGVVSDLWVQGEAVGRGGRQSVATFKIDGTPSKYVIGGLLWGAKPEIPDFSIGDKIVASGKMSSEGALERFIVFNIYIERTHKLIGIDYFIKTLIGLLGIFTGFVICNSAHKRSILTGRDVSIAYVTSAILFSLGFYCIIKAAEVLYYRYIVAKYTSEYFIKK